jgi:hypothetical protein
MTGKAIVIHDGGTEKATDIVYDTIIQGGNTRYLVVLSDRPC